MEDTEFLSSISDMEDNSTLVETHEPPGIVSSILLHIGRPIVIVRYLLEDLQIIDLSPESSDLIEPGTHTTDGCARAAGTKQLPMLCSQLKSNAELIQVIDRVSANDNTTAEYIETVVAGKSVRVKVSKLNSNGHILLHFDQIENKPHPGRKRSTGWYNSDLDYTILNNIDGHIVTNQDGKIIRFNSVAEKIFGYTRFEVQGNNVSLLMTSPHAEKHNDYLKRYNATGRTKVLHTVREVQARRKNGEVFPLELMVSEIYLSNQKFFVGIVRDLSGVKKYDSFDTTIDKYLRHTVFNKIPTGLLIIRQLPEEHRVLLANAQFLKMFNFQYEHIVNVSLIKAFPSLYDHEQACAAMLKSLKTGETQIIKSTKIMNVDVSMLSFSIDPETFGIFFYEPCGQIDLSKQTTVSIDLVEKNKRENAIFLSNIGHELRTNMNTILGNLDLLKAHDNTTAAQEKHIEDTTECASDLINIINDILVYSQIQTDEFTLDLKPFRFQQLIDDCLDTVRNRAAEKNIQLPVSISKKVPDFVIGDYDKMKRVIQNILLNALKYTDIGKIVTRVDVSKNKLRGVKKPKKIPGILERLTPKRGSMTNSGILSREDSSDSESMLLATCKYMLTISITDTGIGIPKSMHENIFKPFVKVKEKNQMYGGTGLGLYICRWYAEKLGGSVRVDSDMGVGSTFYIEIPVNEDKNIARITRHTSSAADFTGKNILIVDPVMTDRVAISKSLMGWNLSTFMCENLDEMKMYLKNRTLNFSIVLLNTIVVPSLKVEHHKLLEKIPIIGLNPPLTDSTEDETIAGFEFEFVFSKPVDQTRLYSACVKLLIDRKSEVGDDVKKKLRILIVDDNYQNTVLISGQLQQMGYTNIAKMANGYEIIKELKKSSPELNYDVILMDFYLPKFTGDLLTQAIKKKIKEPRPMIVGMTASTSVETKRKAFAAGVDAFLLKPLNRKELSTLLMLIMKNKGLIQ